MRRPLPGEVVLMHDTGKWHRVGHYEDEPKISFSFTESFEPDDADIVDGFWVDFTWVSSVRGNRGDMRWLGPESESMYT